MRSAIPWVLASLVPSGLGACATTRGRTPDGKCYTPIVNACQIGFDEECETGSDGCETCGCVPDREDGAGPWPD